MRILFLGSGALACPALRVLRARTADALVGVVTAPDRPGGRRLRMTSCPVKALAESEGLPVWTPEKISDPSVVAELAARSPDVAVVAAYGQFLKPNLLAVPRVATINIHPSLLPKYRGAAPVAWAIARGETETGVTVLHVTPAMDAGDMIVQERVPIRDDDTAETLEPRLAELGAALLDRALDLLVSGRAPRIPQDPAGVTFAPKLTKEDGRIDWLWPAAELRNRVRAFQPWPGSRTEFPAGSGRGLRVLEASVAEGRGEPGEILRADAGGLVVAAGRDAVDLRVLQPEGRRPMSGTDFVNGRRPRRGERMG